MQKNLILVLSYRLFIVSIFIIQAFQIGATLLKFAHEVVIFMGFVKNQCSCCTFTADSEEFSGAFSTIIRLDISLCHIYKLCKNHGFKLNSACFTASRLSVICAQLNLPTPILVFILKMSKSTCK